MYKKTLLVVDGMAAVYRAFFAIRNMKRSDGHPSNALYGFIRMMDQLVKIWKPTHLVVAFDGGVPAERLELVPEYKANRSPMPDELRMQLDSINDYLAVAAIASVRLPACEADDIMATFADRAQSSETQVLLATHDKDLFQLVNANTRIVPIAGTPTPMGPDEVLAKTGVLPDQIVDWLALIGDSADNIKGVVGVGPKTASKLLLEYGSADEVLEHVGDISGDKLKQSLMASRELVTRNQRMVVLDRAVEGVPDWSHFGVAQAAAGPLLAFYETFEFRALAQALREPELF
jgi:DNA polymerase-1